MKAIFSWWNTSLRPAAVSAAPAADAVDMAMKIIVELTQSDDFTAVGLCELSLVEVTTISQRLPSGLACKALVSSVANAKYDLALIYNVKRLVIQGDHEFHTRKFRKRNYFAGAGLNVLIDGVPFYLILSHWPSRIRKPAKDFVRTRYGDELRGVLEEKLTTDPDRCAVLMGDYNDEPADESVAEALMATRDRNRATKERLLYNPFWRHLGHPSAATFERGRDISPAGSYYYRGGVNNRWFTFDQIMVSHHLLGLGAWTLVEKETSIIAPSALLAAIWSKGNRFDHLPVSMTIEHKK